MITFGEFVKNSVIFLLLYYILNSIYVLMSVLVFIFCKYYGSILPTASWAKLASLLLTFCVMGHLTITVGRLFFKLGSETDDFSDFDLIYVFIYFICIFM
jgi:hypothetical protein